MIFGRLQAAVLVELHYDRSSGTLVDVFDSFGICRNNPLSHG